MTQRILSISLGLMLAAGLAAAQTPDHAVIPLSHPSQPATLKVSVLSGSITVRAYDGKDVVVDSTAGDGHARRQRSLPPEAQGMHRLDQSPGLDAQEDNNVVTVRTSVFNGGGNLAIQVPAHTSVNLSTVNGNKIEVTGLEGDIEVKATNGNIVLNQVSGSIIAHALNGRVTATIVRLDANKPSSFSSLNGTIDVTLPPSVKANLRMKTDQGDIYMDDGFNFQPSRVPESDSAAGPGGGARRESNGMYRVRIDHTIYGTLNGGGPEIRFENFNGSIYLRKGK